MCPVHDIQCLHGFCALNIVIILTCVLYVGLFIVVVVYMPISAKIDS